ncbi:hypothetical protein ABHI18_002377 [Aspergillus niger]
MRFSEINMGGWEVLKELMPLFMLISIAYLHYETWRLRKQAEVLNKAAAEVPPMNP